MSLKVNIIPVPYGKTVTYKKGTEYGPSAILKASENIELFDEELNKETHLVGINILPQLKVTNLSPEDMINTVEKNVSNAVKDKKFPIVLGGEHSVTIGVVKALSKFYKDISILYFDAHADLRDTYKGSRYNHACVARRLLDFGKVVEVGIRSFSKNEYGFFRHKDLTVIKMLDILDGKDWAVEARKKLGKNVYISIDLDVLDPSIMPSVGTPEPGGMYWYDILAGLKKIICSKNLVGFDVVELCPIKGMISPDFLAAKLIYKILGYKTC